MADPYKDKVVLYLPLEGSRHGDTVILDKTGKTITRNGSNTNLSTTIIPPFGTTSCYLDGSTGYLDCGANADFDLSTGDFTAEAWIYLTSGETDCTILDNRGRYGILHENWGLFISAGKLSTKIADQTTGGAGTTRASYNGATTVTTGVWHHVALTIAGTTVRTFLDGIQDGSATLSGTPKAGTSYGLFVGYETSGTGLHYFNGYIKDVRITKGVARYTGNFYVRQTTTVDDDYWANVVLAVHGEGTGTTFTDVSNGANTLTTLGNTIHSTAVTVPFGTSSIYFDGLVDAITTTHSSYAFGTGDFTIECWIYLLAGGHGESYPRIIECGAFPADGSWQLCSWMNNNPGTLYFDICNGSTAELRVSIAESIPNSTWTHVAVVKYNNTVSMYYNGVYKGSGTNSRNLSSTAVVVGNSAGSTNAIYAYIKDLRLTKGVARYTQNFNPWRVADPYYKDTVLQISGEGSGTTFTDDSPTTKTITTNGNTVHSTTVIPPFGSSSIYFDGTGDYLSLADSDDFNFGSGDFTVECWVRFSAWPVSESGSYAMGLITKDTEVTGGEFALFVSGTSSSITQLTFRGFSAGNTQNNLSVTGLNFSLNTWYHLAYTRTNGWGRLFINGTIVGEGAHSFTMQNVSAPLLIGRYGWNTSYLYQLQGYIKDLRIIKGVAKYTSDFTPSKVLAMTKSDGRPTAFPDKTTIKTIAKPLDWDTLEKPRILL